jgi:hypothetical protein
MSRNTGAILRFVESMHCKMTPVPAGSGSNLIQLVTLLNEIICQKRTTQSIQRSTQSKAKTALSSKRKDQEKRCEG